MARIISTGLFVPEPRPAPGGFYRGHYAAITQAQPALQLAVPAPPGRWDAARRTGLALLLLLAAFVIFGVAVVIM